MMYIRWILVIIVILALTSSCSSKKAKKKLSNKKLNSQLTARRKDDNVLKIEKIEDQKLKTSYVPRDILDKLRNVHNIDDFVTQFKPEGVHKSKKEDGREHYTLHSLGQEHTNDVEVDLESNGCSPRPQVVPVPADYNSVFWPSCVKLFQCGGCCLNSANFKCMPSGLQNRSTSVFKIPLELGGVPVAHEVYMVHHSHCKCECRVRAKDCLPTQTYDPKNCQCECKKAQEKCPYGKQWSQRQCRCVCSHTRRCATKRFIWDDNRCRCVCKRTKPCRKYTVLDPSTCKCIFLNPNFGKK